MKKTSAENIPYIGFLLILNLLPLAAAQRRGYLTDDAYITLNYAKALVDGGNFIFNHPPPTFGTTTPLLALAIAGLGSVFPGTDLAKIAVYFSALCWALIPWVLLYYHDAFRIKKWQACMLGAVVIGAGEIQFLGMEAYVFAFLLTISIAFFFKGHFIAAGIGSGLLFLTRGEGALIPAVFVIWRLIEAACSKQAVFSRTTAYPIFCLCAAFIITIAPWLFYAQNTFGHFLPNTLSAKMAQVQSGTLPPFYVRLWFIWMPLWGSPFSLPALPYINLWWCLACIGFFTALLRRHRWLIFILWICLYVGGYCLLNVPGPPWYAFPIFFVMNLLVALGLIGCIKFFIKNKKIVSIGSLATILLCSSFFYMLYRPTVTSALQGWSDSRAESYLATASWFKKNTAPSESIACFEIGYLGYFTPNRIIDLAGLVLPEMIPYVMKGDFAGGFWHFNPDYYVHSPIFNHLAKGLVASKEFSTAYRRQAEIPGPANWGDTVIYKRIR